MKMPGLLGAQCIIVASHSDLNSAVDFPLPFPDEFKEAAPHFPVLLGLQPWCNTFVLIGTVVEIFLGILSRRGKKSGETSLRTGWGSAVA